MSRATRQLTEDERWLALFLRNACAPRWSLKTLAMSWPSMMTIEKRIRMDEAHVYRTDDELIEREITHKQRMLKIGLRLGLGARALNV